MIGFVVLTSWYSRCDIPSWSTHACDSRGNRRERRLRQGFGWVWQFGIGIAEVGVVAGWGLRVGVGAWRLGWDSIRVFVRSREVRPWVIGMAAAAEEGIAGWGRCCRSWR